MLLYLCRPVAVFCGIVVAAAAGFSTLDGVGFVDGAFWLLEPSGITQYFRDREGPETLVKAYAMLAVLAMFVTGLWTVETVLSAVFGGQIREEFEAMKIEQGIDECDDHVLVCGYGTFGKTIAVQLRRAGRDVVVIERDDEPYRRAVDEGILAVNGDARHENVLGEAGIERADTVVGAIDDAKTNIQIAVVAKGVASDPSLIVRAGNEMDEALARQVGVEEVIIPEVASGMEVSDTI